MDLTASLYSALTLVGLYLTALVFAPLTGPDLTGCQISYVYDGDTVALLCDGTEQTARLSGFDTPEIKRPGCDAEARLGQQATIRLRRLIAEGTTDFDLLGREKYGRLLIRLRVNGQEVGKTLISEGLALPYDGGTRVNWCERGLG